jgi:hypothetical protein
MKNLIGLSAMVYDLDGAAVIPVIGDISTTRAGGRRATRTATLDGGCVVYDTGYAAADRTIRIETDAAHLGFLEYLVQTYSLVILTLPDGAYFAIPSRYNGDGHKAIITLDITEQMT